MMRDRLSTHTREGRRRSVWRTALQGICPQSDKVLLPYWRKAMKGNNMYVDLGTIFDEIFDAAKKFSEDFKNMGFNPKMHHDEPWHFSFDENVDYYPNFSFPPLNVYMTQDRSLIFEFAIAGFSEKDISLSFQGDYMIFSAKMPIDQVPEEGVKYFKRRLKLKDVEKQKYYVPMDKFDQEKVKAVFRNGILKVTVPPKEMTETQEGIKIEIMKEGE
jgi:HSP20 family protein